MRPGTGPTPILLTSDWTPPVHNTGSPSSRSLRCGPGVSRTRKKDRWADHVAEAQQMAASPRALGRPQRDLAEVLAEMAIGWPGNIRALRALARTAGSPSAIGETWVRQAAATVAWAFRSLFNLPEVTALIRGENRAEPYWRRVVEHCADGNLQACWTSTPMCCVRLWACRRSLPRRSPKASAAAIVRALVDPHPHPPNRRDPPRTRKRWLRAARDLRGRFALRFQMRGERCRPYIAPSKYARPYSPFWPPFSRPHQSVRKASISTSTTTPSSTGTCHQTL